MNVSSPAFHLRDTTPRPPCKPMSTINTQPYHSPCGDLLIGAFGDRLCLCNWTVAETVTARVARILQAECIDVPSPVTEEAAKQLDEYFSRKRTSFSIPLHFAGTAFQRLVWEELRHIPYGTTISYAEQAKRIGRQKAVRAVAAANGANAISIIVPCHRVIGSDKRLTGYGGGLHAKAFLLDLEATSHTL